MVQKNPNVHIEEEGPHFIRNVPDSQGAHMMTKMEHSQVVEVAEIGRDLKKRLRVVEGFSTLRLDDMCLVLDLVIPLKLKVPNFEKWKGDICLRQHLVMFYQKMTSHTHNDKFECSRQFE